MVVYFLQRKDPYPCKISAEIRGVCLQKILGQTPFFEWNFGDTPFFTLFSFSVREYFPAFWEKLHFWQLLKKSGDKKGGFLPSFFILKFCRIISEKLLQKNVSSRAGRCTEICIYSSKKCAIFEILHFGTLFENRESKFSLRYQHSLKNLGTPFHPPNRV